MNIAPVELMEQYPVMTLTQAAWAMQELHVRGKHAGLPDRRRIIQLVRDGKLAVIDASQPVHRWRVSATEVKRYAGMPT